MGHPAHYSSSHWDSHAEQDSQGNWVSHQSPLPYTATAFSPDGSLVTADSLDMGGQLVTMRPDGTSEAPATFGGTGIITPSLAASIVTLLHGTAQF